MTTTTEGDAPTPEMKAVQESILTAFEEHKKAVDENAKSQTAEGEEKVKKINSTIDALRDEFKSLAENQKKSLAAVEERLNRPSEPSGKPEAKSEYGEAIDTFIRKGIEHCSVEQKALLENEVKTLTTTPNNAGGYAIQPAYADEVVELLSEQSPIRSIARVDNVGVGRYQVARQSGALAASWQDETSARDSTTTPTLGQITINAFELAAYPEASNNFLEDSFVDVEAWLRDNAVEAFSSTEGVAFVNGSGTGQPKGFLQESLKASPNVGEAAIQQTTTGVADNFAAQADGGVFVNLMTLIHSLKSVYRQNATLVMSREILGEVRAARDNNGQPIWNPMRDGNRLETVAGYPVLEVEEMEGTGAGNHVAAFGDFRRGYRIAQARGLTVLRNPYVSPGFVRFHLVIRVGGSTVNFDALKVLTMAA